MVTLPQNLSPVVLFRLLSLTSSAPETKEWVYLCPADSVPYEACSLKRPDMFSQRMLPLLTEGWSCYSCPMYPVHVSISASVVLVEPAP